MKNEQAIIHQAISRFPTKFGLRGFPGEQFRLSERSSYVDDMGTIQLYTQRWVTGGIMPQWLDFAKGTEAELRRQVVPSP